MADSHEVCLDELVKIAQGLSLVVKADEIRKRRVEYKLESDGRMTIRTWEPGITFFPLQEVQSRGTISKEDVGYGCGCLICLPTDHEYGENVGAALECRSKIRRKIIHQRLTVNLLSGAYYLTTKVEHLPINQPRGPHVYEASSL